MMYMKKLTKKAKKQIEKDYGSYSAHIIAYIDEMLAIRNQIEKAICYNHEGKMDGMISLSTSPLLNKYCQLRRKNKATICSDCFSFALNEIRDSLKQKLKRNTVLLTSRIYPISFFPILNVRFFRLESFGDLNNEIQLINYFRLCEANTDVGFSLWTKNLFILRRVRKLGYKKPKNLIIIFSSPIKNREIKIDLDPWIDKYFTVFTKDYVKDHGIKINCGKLHCLTCLKCYKHNKIKYIRELLK